MMLPEDWRIVVRDRNRQPTEDVDDYVSLEAELNLNATSRWTLEMAADTRAAANLIKGAGIIVLYRDVVVFSGVADHLETSEGDDGPLLLAGGIDDTGQIEDRLASPDPAGPPYTATAYDLLTNVAAETAMHHYVAVNAGPSATVPRRITGLTMGTDGGRGKTIPAVQVRFDPLMTVLQGLALSSADLNEDGSENQPIRFRVVADLDGGLVFETLPTNDRRELVVFSAERETLGAVTRTQDAPTATRMIAFGSGEGTAREIVEQTDSTQTWEWNRLIERGYDARNSDLATTLEQIAQQIGQGAGLDEVTFEPVDTDALAWLRDYDLGDRASAVLERPDGTLETVEGHISQIKLRIDGDGVTVQPTLTAQPIAPGQTGGGWVSSAGSHLTSLFIQLAANIEPFTRGMAMLWLGAEGAHPSGWAPCDGTAGTTDLRDRFLVAAGTTYTAGTTGGAATANLQHSHTGAAHTHPGSHSHGMAHTHSHSHTGAAHTHPGSHSHGAGTLAISHDHTVDVNHTHGTIQSGGVNVDTVAVGTASLGSGTSDHHHAVTIGALGTTNKTTSTPNNISRSGSTADDSNAPAASYSGNTGTDASASSSSSTDPDSNAPSASYSGDTGNALGTSVSILPPYRATILIQRIV